AVLPRHFAFRLEVCEQREMKITVLPVSAVTPCAINGDAQQICLVALELRQAFVVERHLVAADGTPICRVKGENDRASAKVFQRKLLIGRGWKRKVWRS